MDKSTSQWSKPSSSLVVLSLIMLTSISMFLCLSKLQKNFVTISPNKLKRIAKNHNIFIVNTHTPYEGEIEYTDTFIDLNNVTKKEPLPKNTNTPIIIYDRDGTNGKQATSVFRTLGYKNIHYLRGGMRAWEKAGEKLIDLATLPDIVLPKDGIELPIAWGEIGKQLVDIGVIDLVAFEDAIALTPEQKQILTQGSKEHIRITSQNSQFVVDVLWALGLAQKSKVFSEGPMGKEEKNDIGTLASTGGWNLARGLATNYLNKYDLIPLSDSQQDQVADIAHHVYRPCCNNSTWFPDCNHGMAALAIIELLVSQNVDEATIYKKMLGFNSFWFPDSYLTLAAYFARLGIPWSQVDAKNALSFPYSSGTGAQKIFELVGPLPFTTSFAGGCGV